MLELQVGSATYEVLIRLKNADSPSKETRQNCWVGGVIIASTDMFGYQNSVRTMRPEQFPIQLAATAGKPWRAYY